MSFLRLRSVGGVDRAGGDRAVDALVARCHAGLDAGTLLAEFATGIGRVLSVDAVFCASVDPATMLFTRAATTAIPATLARQFLENELFDDDVNKFTALAQARNPVNWLDHATSDARHRSARYRNVMEPVGFGDELRAALRSGGECWGVLCLHREDGPAGFTASDARVVARVGRHLAEGLRRAVVVDAAVKAAEDDGPGVLIVGDDGSVLATTVAGERWLWELSGTELAGRALPVAIEAVLARLEAIRGGAGAIDVQPRVRVQTRSGRWAVVHAADMTSPRGRGIAVVVEAARPVEIAPLILLAHGLTKREGEIAQLTLQGKTTKVIARELRISANTVEDHLKAVFAKVGVGSRGELTARIYHDHYAR